MDPKISLSNLVECALWLVKLKFGLPCLVFIKCRAMTHLKYNVFILHLLTLYIAIGGILRHSNPTNSWEPVCALIQNNFIYLYLNISKKYSLSLNFCHYLRKLFRIEIKFSSTTLVKKLFVYCGWLICIFSWPGFIQFTSIIVIKGAYWKSPNSLFIQFLHLSNIAIAIYWTFLYCSPFSYRSSNFAIAKLSLLLLLFANAFKSVKER